MSYPRLVSLLAAVALVAVLAAGPVNRFGLANYKVALAMMVVGGTVGLIAFVLAVFGLMVSGFAPYRSLLALAAALGAVAAVPPMLLLKAAKAVPPIHDISTDVSDPPAFDKLLPARLASDNGADYNADVGQVQRVSYPDIAPHPFAGPPAAAYEKALAAAKALGWEIAAADAATGTIEATATTAWFGFKDDVIVRVRPSGTASVVDVRSVSRVGISDVGANARRIREFLAKL